MAFCRLSKPINQCGKIGMLGGLHEAEMTFRQYQRRVARQHAEKGNMKRADCIGDHCSVPITADPVEDHAGDTYGGIVRDETADQSRRRLRLARK